MKVGSIVSNGTIFHTVYPMEKEAMDNTNDTRRIVLAMAELILLFVTFFLTGCATVETRPAAPTGDVLTACRMLYQEVDAAIERAGVRDYGSSPVRDFPLAVNSPACFIRRRLDRTETLDSMDHAHGKFGCCVACAGVT